MKPADKFLLWVLERYRARTPYLWGGKDERAGASDIYPTGGLDCSGLVTRGLHLAGGPDCRATHNTDRIWTEWPRIASQIARPGDVVLYRGPSSTGPDDVEHVMVLLVPPSPGSDGLVVGQAYGGSANTTVAYSLARHHVTQCLPLGYRSGLAGFVRLPFPTS